MADRVTCCPHCSTSFRITDAQLQTARGAVRCGSCLQIFRASEHLLPLPGTATAASEAVAACQPDVAAPTAPAQERRPEADTVEDRHRPWLDDSHEPALDSRPELSVDDDQSVDQPVVPGMATGLSEPDTRPLTDDQPADEEHKFELDPDDDLLISDDMELDAPERSFGELSDDFLDSSELNKPIKSSLFDRELKVKEVESDHSDESWAEELLQEIETEAITTPPPRPASDILKSFGEFTTAPTTHTPAEPPFADDEEDYGATRYHQLATGSFDIPDQHSLADEEVDAVLGERFGARREPLFSVTGERDLEPGPAGSDGADEIPPPAVGRPQRAPIPPREQDLLLQGIAPAPVEMDWHVEPSPWPGRLLWGGLSLLACLVLVAQFAWFKFDEYSRIEPWRSAYATLCPLVGCTLPPLADPARVKAYNLVVRSNPQAANALIIDSILLNTAGFAQPFPDFALSFTNLQGKQLAYRRFTPQEYLGGEMAGVTLMPSGQPVHISLEIVDPGPEAVNYTATIPRD